MSTGRMLRAGQLAILPPNRIGRRRHSMQKTVDGIVEELRGIADRTAKLCQVCKAASPPSAFMCAKCGEASWKTQPDMVIRHKKEDLGARAAAARNVVLGSLRALRTLASTIPGFRVTLDEEPEIVSIAGRNATVFARMSMSDPRNIGGSDPDILIMFANRYIESDTDGFVVGCVSTRSRGADGLWPLRWVRFHNVSSDTTIDIVSSLLSETVYYEL